MIKQCLVVTFFFLSAIANAQLQRNFTSYTVDEGLAQNTVWDAYQDYKGYMWFGTADGISRFDGYEMKHYKFRLDDSTSLLGNSAFKFYEDSEKRLWISHDKGLSIYNRAKDCFTNIKQDNKGFLNGDRYSTILGEDKRGYIWSISGYHQLVGFNKKDASVHKTISVSQSQYVLSSIRTCVQSGKYIIGYLNDSFTTWFRFNTETEQSEIINGPKLFTGYFMLYNDSTICSFSKGNLYLYNINQNTFTSKPLKGDHKPIDDAAATSLAWWQGKIYLGTNRGLYVFNPSTSTFEEHIISFNKTERISFFYIQYLRVDKSGNLWICTNGAGAKCLSPYQNKFKHYASTESRNSLVKTITKDENGNIYTGLYAQGIIRYQPNGGIKQYKFGKKEMELTHVLGMMAWNKRIIMVNDRLLKVFDPVSQKVISESVVFNRYKKEHGREAAYVAYPFFRKYNNELFVSCDLALLKIKPNGKPETVISIENRDTFISTFEIVNDTNWWIGTTRTLYLYNPVRKTWKGIPIFINTKTICYSKHTNELWVGGNSGLFRLTTSGKLLQQYGAADGLPDDFIYGILEDKNGQMWMSHNKGMSVYFPRTKTFKHYSVKDGLQSNEFNTGAYYKDEEELLYFGGVNGINVIDPDNIIENKNVPQIGINEILVDDLPYKFDTAFNEIHTINLSYLQNTLSFDFSALEFSNLENNTYRYKMEGYDNNWIESGTKHFARYASLPPGNYTLKIKAANGDGFWNETPREIFINITPPYWQRTWFYVIVVFVVLGLIILAVYYYNKRQQQKLKQEIEVQHKLEEERLRISRDLHDNVGAQLSFLITNVEWMLEHPEQVNEAEEKQRLQALSETGRNAILTLRQTIWAISHSSLSVDDFADRFKQFALKMVEFNKDVQLHFSENFEQTQTLSPSVALNLFRICQEGFNNSLKHAKANNINLHFISNNQHHFLFTIADDGVGFEWNEAISKGHYGLHNMKARATETNADLQIQSQLGKGTTLTLIVK